MHRGIRGPHQGDCVLSRDCDRLSAARSLSDAFLEGNQRSVKGNADSIEARIATIGKGTRLRPAAAGSRPVLWFA